LILSTIDDFILFWFERFYFYFYHTFAFLYSDHRHNKNSFPSTTSSNEDKVNEKLIVISFSLFLICTMTFVASQNIQQFYLPFLFSLEKDKYMAVILLFTYFLDHASIFTNSGFNINYTIISSIQRKQLNIFIFM